MPTATIEERVAQLETAVSEIKLTLPPSKRDKNPWATFGLMAGHEGYAEVVRLGAEYRQRDRERVLQANGQDAE